VLEDMRPIWLKPETIGRRLLMGNFTWEGWQTSAEDAPQPTSILYGKNLKTSSRASSQEESPVVQPEENPQATPQAQKPAK